MTMTKPSSARITGLRTVGIPVSNQDRALDFYVRTLGLEPRLDFPLGSGSRWIELGPGPAATTVALIAASDKLPAGVETGIRFTTTDAEATHAFLTSSGVDVDAILRWPGVPAMFAFRDPDGNGLEMVEETSSLL
jgi:catechol 2,3-dioxygenase-like lactoylglutathione lyase family enzyme